MGAAFAGREGAPMFLFAALLATSHPCNAHPVFRLRTELSGIRVAGAGRNFRASAHLAFGVVTERRAVITIADPGLRAHAAGHAAIAYRVARSSNGVIQAVGTSRAQAVERLKEGAAQLMHQAQNELDREERVYDTVTRDGLEQRLGPDYGFPGGPDARVFCGAPVAAMPAAPSARTIHHSAPTLG